MTKSFFTTHPINSKFNDSFPCAPGITKAWVPSRYTEHARIAADLDLPSRHTEHVAAGLDLPPIDYAALNADPYPGVPTGSVPRLSVKPALAEQVGGAHYKGLKIQPVEYIHANGLGYFEGNVVKYVTRWQTKGGVDDLKKARHYIDMLLELQAA
jgi:hypothetical protein